MLLRDLAQDELLVLSARGLDQVAGHACDVLCVLARRLGLATGHRQLALVDVRILTFSFFRRLLTGTVALVVECVQKLLLLLRATGAVVVVELPTRRRISLGLVPTVLTRDHSFGLLYVGVNVLLRRDSLELLAQLLVGDFDHEHFGVELHRRVLNVEPGLRPRRKLALDALRPSADLRPV